MVATLPATTATITARNMIHAPTNELSGLGSTSLSTAPITTKAMRLNSPANAPTTDIHHHDKRATSRYQQGDEPWRDRRGVRHSRSHLEYKPASRDKKGGHRQLASRGQRASRVHRTFLHRFSHP